MTPLAVSSAYRLVWVRDSNYVEFLALTYQIKNQSCRPARPTNRFASKRQTIITSDSFGHWKQIWSDLINIWRTAYKASTIADHFLYRNPDQRHERCSFATYLAERRLSAFAKLFHCTVGGIMVETHAADITLKWIERRRYKVVSDQISQRF